MKINTLTHAEEVLMQIMWKLESAYLKEILAEYPEPKPHQNTVSTFVKILVDKEFLSVVREGRIFKYVVSVPREAYRNFLLKNFLENYFENSAATLVKSLMDENLLNTSELEKLEINLPAEPAVISNDETKMSDFIDELTSDKKAKKKGKKKKKNKKT